jgi:hypothetical protein
LVPGLDLARPVLVDADIRFDKLDPTLPPVMVGDPMTADRIHPRPYGSSSQKSVTKSMDRKQSVLKHVLDHLAVHSFSQICAQYCRGLDEKRLVGGLIALLAQYQETGNCLVSFRIQRL